MRDDKCQLTLTPMVARCHLAYAATCGIQKWEITLSSTASAEVSLVQRMRLRTAALHRQAERSGTVAELLRGRISPATYALYLRNLLPAYQAMEQGLQDRRDDGLFHALAQPALYRCEAIIADLRQLTGSDWEDHLRLLPCGHQYARRVAHAASGSGTLLLAHYYTRYLGDLSGGQIMGRRLAELLPPHIAALSFTQFPLVDDLRGFTGRIRAAIDHAGSMLTDPALVIEEAATAFRQNINLSNEVDSASRLLPARGPWHHHI